jgi:hypothetical protein
MRRTHTHPHWEKAAMNPTTVPPYHDSLSLSR